MVEEGAGTEVILAARRVAEEEGVGDVVEAAVEEEGGEVR